MMTEGDAKKKWCPFARVGGMSGANRNVGVAHRDYALCIASACMAWRISGDGWLRSPTDPGPMQFKTMGEYRDALKNGAQEVGYCGMAGRPE